MLLLRPRRRIKYQATSVKKPTKTPFPDDLVTAIEKSKMDAFLLGEEAATIEEKVRGQNEIKRSEQGPQQLRVEEIGTAHDEEDKKSPDIRKSDDI